MKKELSAEFLEKNIDQGMRYAIYNLNRKGYETIFCCEGHWYEPLAIYCGMYLGFATPLKKEFWPKLPSFPWKDDNKYASRYRTPIMTIGVGYKHTFSGTNEECYFYWKASNYKKMSREEKDKEHEQFIKELNEWVDSLPDN